MAETSKTGGRYRAVLLFGAPGTGKGTQGKTLGTLPGFMHLACGDVFRAMNLDSEIGKVFREYSSRGELVPDEITVRLWRDYIRGMELMGLFDPRKSILVLDGIPRNREQAELLEDTLDVVQVFHLTCADPTPLVERMRQRALHDNRLDDANEKVIRHRLEVYEKETSPVLAYYDPDIVYPVEATLSPLEALTAIAGKLANMNQLAQSAAAGGMHS